MSINSGLVLNLGCGTEKRADCININYRSEANPDLVCDVKKLPYSKQSVDKIVADDIVEHFGHKEVKNVLTHWYELLRVGGTLEIKTPNIDTIIEAYQSGRIPISELIGKLYGRQRTRGDYHYNGFNPETITELLEGIGFKVIEVIPKIADDIPPKGGGQWSNMKLLCQKFSP